MEKYKRIIGEIVSKYDTPFFIYSIDTITEKIETLRDTLGNNLFNVRGGHC